MFFPPNTDIFFHTKQDSRFFYRYFFFLQNFPNKSCWKLGSAYYFLLLLISCQFILKKKIPPWMTVPLKRIPFHCSKGQLDRVYWSKSQSKWTTNYVFRLFAELIYCKVTIIRRTRGTPTLGSVASCWQYNGNSI